MTDLAVTRAGPEKPWNWRGRVRTGAAWALHHSRVSAVGFAWVAPYSRTRMTSARFSAFRLKARRWWP